MNYFVDYEKVTEEEFFEKLDEAIRDYVDENLDEIIDEGNPEVEICGSSFDASYILRKCDPVYYSCYGNDVVNAMFEDAKYNFRKYHSEKIAGVRFETAEEEDGE